MTVEMTREDVHEIVEHLEQCVPLFEIVGKQQRAATAREIVKEMKERLELAKMRSLNRAVRR